jgi:twinfilin-like protein
MEQHPCKMISKKVYKKRGMNLSLESITKSKRLDYQHVSQYLEETIPAYVFVRLDEKASTGEYNWLFLCYVPDKAKIRDKMLYASTRATLTKELGDYRFADQVYGTDKVDPTLNKVR